MTTTTIGAKPRGTANGTERWATIAEDDGTVTVTAYRGWGITDEVTLSGKSAPALAPSIAHTLTTEG